MKKQIKNSQPQTKFTGSYKKKQVYTNRCDSNLIANQNQLFEKH